MLLIFLGFSTDRWQGKQGESFWMPLYGPVAPGQIINPTQDDALWLLETGDWAPVTETDDPAPIKRQKWGSRTKERTRLLKAAALPSVDQPQAAPYRPDAPARVLAPLTTTPKETSTNG